MKRVGPARAKAGLEPPQGVQEVLHKMPRDRACWRDPPAGKLEVIQARMLPMAEQMMVAASNKVRNAARSRAGLLNVTDAEDAEMSYLDLLMRDGGSDI